MKRLLILWMLVLLPALPMSSFAADNSDSKALGSQIVSTFLNQNVLATDPELNATVQQYWHSGGSWEDLLEELLHQYFYTKIRPHLVKFPDIYLGDNYYVTGITSYSQLHLDITPAGTTLVNVSTAGTTITFMIGKGLSLNPAGKNALYRDTTPNLDAWGVFSIFGTAVHEFNHGLLAPRQEPHDGQIHPMVKGFDEIQAVFEQQYLLQKHGIDGGSGIAESLKFSPADQAYAAAQVRSIVRDHPGFEIDVLLTSLINGHGSLYRLNADDWIHAFAHYGISIEQRFADLLAARI